MNISKKLIPCAILLVVALCFSSCNRGMGCPSFSISQVAKAAVELPAAIVVKP